MCSVTGSAKGGTYFVLSFEKFYITIPQSNSSAPPVSQYENSHDSTFSKSQQKQKSTAIKPIRSERSLQCRWGGSKLGKGVGRGG